MSAWPMVPLWLPERGQVVLTTSIGFPVKARQLRRDPRVALLFSDPTGSGKDAPPMVLLQGTAEVSGRVLTHSPDLLAHWARVHAIQPASRLFSAAAPLRWFMDWYYMRLVVNVQVDRVLCWPDRDINSAPQVVDVAGCADNTPNSSAYGTGRCGAAEATVGPDGPALAGREPRVKVPARRLARFGSAVLAGRDDTGHPVALRVQAVRGAESGVWTTADTPGVGLSAGEAMLLFHSHDERLSKLRSLQVVGRIDHGERGWEFRARRLVNGLGVRGPVADLLVFLRARRRAARVLARRGLDRPRVPWRLLSGSA